MELEQEYGWLIERLLHGKTMWWTGRGVDRYAFSEDPNEGIRFAREADATAVRVYLLGDEGRSTYHIWVLPSDPENDRSEQ